MRVVKEANERRNEILDVAEKLFTINGFDATSTNDILKEIGIARGTLYYHFASKEDILDAVIDRLTRGALAKAAAIAHDDSIPYLQRMMLVMMSLNLQGDTWQMISEEIHRPQNALMHQKMQDTFLSQVVPLMSELVRIGVKAGEMKCEYVDETIEMILTYSYIAFDDMNEYQPEERQKKVLGFIHNTEVLLGMESGSLMKVMIPLFDRE